MSVVSRTVGIEQESVMGFRFRKSVKLFPGVRVNFSKTGVGFSAGVPGGVAVYSDGGGAAGMLRDDGM